MEREVQIGAYFLANDSVYDWVIAFLESFREFNPCLKLYLIPFDKNYTKIQKLSNQFSFDIFEECELFNRLEIIGKQLEIGYTDTGKYWFRRFASFWGLLDKFIYLDSRIIILNNLEPLINSLDKFKCDFIHFEGGLDQVYNPGFLRESLVLDKKAQGFNSGKWIARKEIFDIEYLEEISFFIQKNRSNFNSRNTDQFFLNYLIHSTNIRYASIHDLMPNLSRLTWPAMPGGIYRENGIYKTWSYNIPDNHKKEMILVHWAGIRESPVMPQRNIYLRYRLKSEPLITQLKLLLRDLLLKPVLSLYMQIKSNRLINMYYHNVTDIN